jgi:hypothetical protein
MKQGVSVFESLTWIFLISAAVSFLTSYDCHQSGVSAKQPIKPELIITATDTTYIYKSDEDFTIFEKLKHPFTVWMLNYRLKR